MSKLFTDIGIMQLVERGQLDLDAPIQTIPPRLPPAAIRSADRSRLRQLTVAPRRTQDASRRSATTSTTPDPSLAATVASLNRTTLVYTPGKHTKYSNAGIAVLGYVLEKTQRESFYPYLNRAVLDPMGLQQQRVRAITADSRAPRERHDVDDRRRALRRADVRARDGTVRQHVQHRPRPRPFSPDPVRARHVGDGRRVLAAATLDSMWTPQFAPRGARTGFGIGFRIGQMDGRRVIGHGGAIYGFATTLLALPDDSLGVVVVATLDGATP